MRTVFVYADSLTWGIIPHTRGRLPFEHRWPGVLELTLATKGMPARVIEDCLNGRRTVWDDPFKPGRNGLDGLAQKMESHAPLDLVVIMLGTNDFQRTHDNNAWLSAEGIASLIHVVRAAPIEPGMPRPEILVVAPPPFGTPSGSIAPKFENAGRKSIGLAAAYQEVCARAGCRFFDAATVTEASRVDGVHLDRDQHLTLGRALAEVIYTLL